MGGLRKTIFKSQNLSLKIISFILALSLELYFYSPDNSATADILAAVELLDIPSSVMSISPSLETGRLTAKVRIRGPRPLIEKAQKGIYNFSVRYPKIPTLAFSAALNPEDLNLPSGIDVIDTEPSSVTFEFEKIINKKLPIIIDKVNALPSGFYLDKEVVTPDSVLVSGPTTMVDSLKEIYTQEVDLQQLSHQQKFELGLNPPSPFLKLSTNTAVVELIALPIIAKQNYEKVNIKIISPSGYAATVEPSKANVVLVGAKDDLELLKATKVDLIADSQGLKEGKHEVGLRADLPPGVKILSTEPEKVLVILRKQ